MSRYTGNRAAAAPRKGGSPMWVGILVGVVAGVGMAAGVAWYMMKSQGPFLAKPPVADKLEAVPPSGTAAPTTPQAGATGGKPRFEFYNVLTDKQAGKTAASTKPAEKTKQADSKPADSKPVAAFDPHILQVGSFSKAEDAEKLKAKLALIGAEAHVQTANVPDKGVYYRVRLGPYKKEDEMNKMRSFLKQNDVDSTPMRAQ